jgi:hypothetical protein
MMEQPDVDISQARRAFETYWQHHERYRGDQANRFERWYALNSSRLDPQGEVIGAAQIAAEFHRLRSQLDVKQEGDWYNYGPSNETLAGSTTSPSIRSIPTSCMCLVSKAGYSRPRTAGLAGLP